MARDPVTPSPMPDPSVAVPAILQQLEAFTLVLLGDENPPKSKAYLAADIIPLVTDLHLQVETLTTQLDREQSISELRKRTNEYYLRHFKEIAAVIGDDEPANADHVPSLVSVLKFILERGVKAEAQGAAQAATIQALREYMVHKWACSVQLERGECTCGLASLLSQTGAT